MTQNYLTAIFWRNFNKTFYSKEDNLKSNTRFLLALAIGVILVAGALTLPLAFDDHHMADAKKKKSKKYHGKKQK